MGPTLFSKEYKGTVYAVHLLPIGGFCAMGEDDEETESPGNFNKKSVWARISVIAADRFLLYYGICSRCNFEQQWSDMINQLSRV